MRCDIGSCMDRATVWVHVWAPPEIQAQEASPFDYYSHYFFSPDDTGPRRGRAQGLCYGCYLRLVRQRRRAGLTKPWPKDSEPLESVDFWAAFDGWEPEPENPSDEYMLEMEATVWKGR